MEKIVLWRMESVVTRGEQGAGTFYCIFTLTKINQVYTLIRENAFKKITPKSRNVVEFVLETQRKFYKFNLLLEIKK